MAQAQKGSQWVGTYPRWHRVEGSIYPGQQDRSFRIVLVGKTGVGKSATGNTILGKDAFHKSASSNSVTKVCTKASNVVDGKNIEVVDTPGWCDTELSEAEIVEEAVKCIDISSPGPHVFLLVLQIGRFTEEEKKTVRKIQEVFGEGASKYMMVLFTRGDDLEGSSIDDYLQRSAKDLQNIVFTSCEGRYHLFNNREKNHHQVPELLRKIQDMVRQNGGGCYTNVTYKLLEDYKKRETEMQEKIKNLEKEMKLKMEELEKKEQLMQQEREEQKQKEAELKVHMIKMKFERAVEGALVEGMLGQMVLEEKKRQRQAQQQRSAEQMRGEPHQQSLKAERQVLKIEKVHMFREHQDQVRDLEHQIQQVQAEKKDYLKKSVKKNSRCSIS